MHDFERDAYEEMQDMRRSAGKNDSRYIQRGDDNEGLLRLAARLQNIRPGQQSGIVFGDVAGKKNVASYNDSGYSNMPSISTGGIRFKDTGVDVIGRRIAAMNQEEEIDLELKRLEGNNNPYGTPAVKRLFASHGDEELDFLKECPRCKQEMTPIGRSKTAVSFTCADCGTRTSETLEVLRREAKDQYAETGKFVRLSRQKDDKEARYAAHQNRWERWAQKQAAILDEIGVDPRELRREVNSIRDWYDATGVNIEEYSLDDAISNANAWERG